MTQLSNSSCCDPTQMIISICWQYRHTKQSLHMAWTWCWGAVFLRLTKADPKWCLLLLLLTNFTIDITKSRMHAKKRGRKTPKHARMFPCCYSPFTLRTQISDYLQMTDMQHLEIPLSALNFGKPKVKPAAKLACGLARPGVNPRSLLLTSTPSKLFIYCKFSCFSSTCFHKPGDSNNAAIPVTKEKVFKSPSLPWTNSMVQNFKELQDLFFHAGKI